MNDLAGTLRAARTATGTSLDALARRTNYSKSARAVDPNVRTAVTAELARIWGRVAWCHAEAGNTEGAAREYAAALDLAEDPDLRAQLRIDMASTAVVGPDPRAAIERLDSAVVAFGPDRARATRRCRQRLDALLAMR